MKFMNLKQYIDAKHFAGDCEPVVMVAKGQSELDFSSNRFISASLPIIHAHPEKPGIKKYVISPDCLSRLCVSCPICNIVESKNLMIVKKDQT